MVTDEYESCTESKGCNLHNLQCGYPNCTIGRAEKKKAAIKAADKLGIAAGDIGYDYDLSAEDVLIIYREMKKHDK